MLRIALKAAPLASSVCTNFTTASRRHNSATKRPCIANIQPICRRKRGKKTPSDSRYVLVSGMTCVSAGATSIALSDSGSRMSDFLKYDMMYIRLRDIDGELDEHSYTVYSS